MVIGERAQHLSDRIVRQQRRRRLPVGPACQQRQGARAFMLHHRRHARGGVADAVVVHPGGAHGLHRVLDGDRPREHVGEGVRSGDVAFDIQKQSRWCLITKTSEMCKKIGLAVVPQEHMYSSRFRWWKPLKQRLLKMVAARADVRQRR